MLLTPQLDYQLMEHWAPSVADLLQMEAEEAGARTPTPVEKPSEARESFKNQVKAFSPAIHLCPFSTPECVDECSSIADNLLPLRASASRTHRGFRRISNGPTPCHAAAR